MTFSRKLIKPHASLSLMLRTFFASYVTVKKLMQNYIKTWTVVSCGHNWKISFYINQLESDHAMKQWLVNYKLLMLNTRPGMTSCSTIWPDLSVIMSLSTTGPHCKCVFTPDWNPKVIKTICATTKRHNPLKKFAEPPDQTV